MTPNHQWIWLSEWFWNEIGIAVDIAKKDLPTADEDTLRDMILRGWLTLSQPAGSA